MRSLLDAIEQEAEFHAPMDEIGSSDISAMVNGVMKTLGIKEANEEGTPDIVEQAVQAYKGKKNENMYEVFKNFAKEDLDAIIKTGYLPEAEVESVQEGVAEADEEVKAWAEKYNKHMGTNGDQLAHGWLQTHLNTGIESDGYNDDEYYAYNKKYKHESDMDWKDEDQERFFKESPITSAMHDEIDAIMQKYGIDEEDVNRILGYFDMKEEQVKEGKLGFKDLEEFGKEMASKIDTEARKRGSADMEPGEADELRFKIAKEFGLVEDKKEKEQTVEQHEIDEILYLAGVK